MTRCDTLTTFHDTTATSRDTTVNDQRVRRLVPQLDGEWWELVTWHQRRQGKEWEVLELPSARREPGYDAAMALLGQPAAAAAAASAPERLYLSFVTGRSASARGDRTPTHNDPGRAPDPPRSAVRALLGLLGLGRFAAAFAAEDMDDVLLLRRLPPADRLHPLRELGLSGHDAGRLSALVDELLDEPALLPSARAIS